MSFAFHKHAEPCRSCPRPAANALTPGAIGRIVKDRSSATLCGSRHRVRQTSRHVARIAVWRVLWLCGSSVLFAQIARPAIFLLP